jgi:CsoR family transcriptional regulator, copper-sensing transcriptional repressor
MTIQTKNPETKSQIKGRLARVEGQLRGVRNMIEEERDCKEILQQLIAIRAAVHSASLQFLQDVASDCLLNLEKQANPEDQRARMAELIRLLGKVS